MSTKLAGGIRTHIRERDISMAHGTRTGETAASRTETGKSSRKWWALAATCLGLFMALLDLTIVNVALPTIQRDLKASFSDLQWIVNGYAIALAVLLVTAGRLGDVFGRKRLFMIGLGLFSFGSLLCSLSSNLAVGAVSPIQVLLTARAIQGAGGSIMLPLSLAIISATFHGPERGVAIGIYGGVTGLATAIGPVFGGILVEKVSWQSIFYVNIPIGIIGIFLSAWAIVESRDTRAPRRVDVFGLLTLTVAIFFLVLGLTQSGDPDKGFGSPYILTLLAISALAFVVFVLGELRLKNPMVDPRIFANASYSAAAVVAFTLSAGLFSLFFFLTLFLQYSLGFSPLQAGLRFLPLSGLVLVTAPLAGAFTSRVGARPVMFAGMAVLVVAVLLMTRIGPSDTQSDWVVLLPAFILGGLGSGLVNPPIGLVAVGAVTPGRVGMAAGVNSVARQIGTAFGIALLGALLSHQYNTMVHDKVLTLTVPNVPAVVAHRILTSVVSGIQSAGTIAGSEGLPASQVPPVFHQYTHLPLFAQLQQIAHAAFINGLTDILRVAVVILVLGMLATLLVKKSDLISTTGEAEAPA
jgi:EmrB/QacA subfamily drug resistance transporter